MKRVIFRLSALCGALAIVALIGTSAPAAILTAGQGNTTPDTFSAPTGTVLATISSTFTTGTGVDSGTLVTEVIRTGAGTLDFLYQVTANSSNPDNFSTVSANTFSGTYLAGVSPDVGYVTGPVSGFSTPTAGITPNAVSSSSPSGSSIDFFFNSGSNGIAKGDVSAVLEIQTDATSYAAAIDGVTDGSTANIASYGPVPEPWSVLVWAGFGGLAAVYQWRRRRTK